MFAIITDIHGNYPALRAALDAIDEAGASHIYGLGDYVGIGPDSNEVLGLLFARQDVTLLRGNHDEAVLALLQGAPYPESHANVRQHHQWIADRLDPSFIPKMAALPRSIQGKEDTHTYFMTHYHIAEAKKEAPISRDPFSPIVEPSYAAIARLFAGYREELICFGHHHPTHYFAGRKPVFLNPGSLGCYDKPFARYGLVDSSAHELRVELKEAAYDNRAFLASYDKLEVPNRAFILDVFHGGQSY